MDKIFTIEDVKNQHLSVIEGKIYDLKEFSKIHPGGLDILIYVGRNATPHFHINHPFMSVETLHNKLDKYCLGIYKEEGKDCADYYIYDDPFTRELLSTVKEHFKNKSIYATTYSYLKIYTILSYYFISLYLFLTEPSYFHAFLKGIFSYFVALCIMHTANHGGFSPNPIINSILGLSMNMLGSDRLWWMGHNIGHHAFVSVINCDPDESNTEPMLISNPNSTTKLPSWLNPFQFILFLISLFLFPIVTLFNPDHFYHKNKDRTISLVKNQFIITLISKSLVLISYIYILYICNFYQGLKYLIFTNYISTLLIALPFELSHHFLGNPKNTNQIIDGKIVKKNWYVEQIQSSCDYGGDISNMLSGGLSSQTVHHLFPRMDHDNYVELREIIKPICKKYKVKYTHYSNILENIFSTVRYFHSF